MLAASSFLATACSLIAVQGILPTLLDQQRIDRLDRIAVRPAALVLQLPVFVHSKDPLQPASLNGRTHVIQQDHCVHVCDAERFDRRQCLGCLSFF